MSAKGCLVLILVCLSLVGCTSVTTKQNALLRKNVYAAQDALRVGRVDLAKAYTAQAARLIAPPKKREVVKPVETNGTRYVVLPQEFQGSPALAIGSPALTSLVAADKPLEKQFAAEAKALARNEAATDKVIAEKQAIVDKAEEQALIARHSFWSRVKFWGAILLSLGSIAALCYVYPPAIPFVVAALRWAAQELFAVVHWLWLAVVHQFKK